MGSSVDRREAVRLTGRVVEVRHPPRRWFARAGAQQDVRGEAGVVVVDVDGATVTVELAADALDDDGEAHAGSWGELVEQHRPPWPASWAPAFERATLRVATVVVGDALEVYGEALERGFADDGGPRDAPVERLRRVRGLVAATGADRVARVRRRVEDRFPPAQRPAAPSWSERRARRRAARRADPRAKDPSTAQHPQDPLLVGVVVVWLAATVVAGGVAVHTGSVAARGLAIGAALGALVFRPTPRLCPFRFKGTRHRGALHPGGGTQFLAGLVYAMALIAWGWEDAAVAAYAALGLAALALVGGAAGTKTYAALAALRRAPRWDGALGGWVALEGEVRDPTPITLGGRASALAVAVGMDEGLGSNPDKVVWTRFHEDGTFLVETAAGVVEVSSHELVWATSATRRLDHGGDGADYQVVEEIPVGGRVLAVGRVEAGAPGGPVRLRAAGTRPALLLATGPHGEPRGWAERLVAARRVTLVGVLALAAAAAAQLGWLG